MSSLPVRDYDAPPPTKASLLKWWKAFTKNSSAGTKKQAGGGGAAVVPPQPYRPPGRGLTRPGDGEGRVFGVSLDKSLKYASVAISMVGPDNKAYVYGYVPIIVAKCGMRLKEIATQTEGIFRVSGSSKRINLLQDEFDVPPRYGKDLDWDGYSVHDAASVLRRYLNMLPDPVIPANLYLDFTAVLQKSQSLHSSISEYRTLISLLPATSRYLLLYLLDFLSVFARSSQHNLMTASNLATVFQPGLVSTRKEVGEGALLGFPGFPGGKLPPGAMSGQHGLAAEKGAGEHGKGKEVLEFLIEQQSHFMLGLEPPVPSSKRIPQSQGTSGTAAGGTRGQAGAGDPLTSSGYGVQPGTELSRRGSEKSVERRRLRKNSERESLTSGGGAKVKRSRTLPGREGRSANPPSPRPSPRLEQSSSLAPAPPPLQPSPPRADSMTSPPRTDYPSPAPTYASSDARMSPSPEHSASGPHPPPK